MRSPAVDLDHVERILTLVRNEFIRATHKHGAIHSAHEGYGVLQEEFDELWDDVKADNLDAAFIEAIQVAAMGVRFVYDLE